jgi:hypothetical protein
MPFNSAIPQPADLLSNSQGQLLANNGFLDTTFGRNHFPFTDGTANNGHHTFIELVNQAAIPTPVPGLTVGEGTLYCKSVSSRAQLFYTNDNSGNEYQLTNVSNSAYALFAQFMAINTDNTGGWTFLAGGTLGGMILNYGELALHAGTNAPVVQFARAYSNSVFSVVITPSTASATSSQVFTWINPTKTQMQIAYNGFTNLDTITYMAIGI